MKVQLLLLLAALAGPFCAFTRASPTALPSDDHEAASRPWTTGREDLIVVSGPTEAAPTMVPEVLLTTMGPSAGDGGATTQEDGTEVPGAASTAAPGHSVTELPAVETATLAAATVEAKAEVTAAAEADPKDKVVIEEGMDEASEGLSSGQVAGIVIGALLALVIVIAVAIAAVRRMGKYSP